MKSNLPNFPTLWLVFFLLHLSFQSVAIADDTLKEPLSIEQVTAYLNRHPEIKTVDDFLPHLPQQFRHQRVFAFNSRSRQGSSPSHPRTIMLAKDSTFILTVTGNDNQINGQDIEMMQIKNSAQKVDFQFGGYSFDKTKNGKVKGFTGINPKACTSCHERQGIVRPIWDAKNFWPGFFGEHNSMDFTAKDPHFAYPNQEMFYKQFQDTLKNRPGRFKFFFEDPAKVTPEMIFRVNQSGQGKTITPQPIAHGEAEPLLPPGTDLRRLSLGFNYYNFRRAYLNLKSKPFYKKMKWALLAASIDCDDIESFVPEETKTKMRKAGFSYAEIKKQNEASLIRLGQKMLERAADAAGRIDKERLAAGKIDIYAYDFSEYNLSFAHRARYLMNSEGGDILDWYVRREPEVGWFSDDADEEDMWTRFFLGDILKERPDLRSEFLFQDNPVGESNYQRAYFDFMTALKAEPHLTDTHDTKKFKNVCNELRAVSLNAYKEEANSSPHRNPREDSEQTPH